MNLFDVFEEGTLDANTLRTSGYWIPYEEGTYETLSLEERKYYLDLVKLAKRQISQAYYEFNGKHDISDSICDFFSDLCNHVRNKGREIYDRFLIRVPELDIPNFSNNDFWQSLCYITYCPDDKEEWTMFMEYDQSADDLKVTNLENLIDDNYINSVIIETLKSKLDEQENGIKDTYYFSRPKPKISNDDIVNYLLELEWKK